MFSVVNGGGQNQARAILTGALAGAPSWSFQNSAAIY